MGDQTDDRLGTIAEANDLLEQRTSNEIPRKVATHLYGFVVSFDRRDELVRCSTGFSNRMLLQPCRQFTPEIRVVGIHGIVVEKVGYENGRARCLSERVGHLLGVDKRVAEDICEDDNG